MKFACLTAFASLRGALLFTVLASIAGAQNQSWIRQFGTTDDDRGRAAAPDGSGGVYVGGYTFFSSGQRSCFLAHYDSAGNQTWIRQFGSTGDDRIEAAAPDGAGGVYVSGSTRGSLGGPNAGTADVWLAHYDSAGNQTWIRQFGTTTYESAYAVAPDGSGGVYVSGHTVGNLGGPNAGGADVWLAHFDGAGDQTWILQFGTTTPEYVSAAAPDGSGGVYVIGETRGSLGGQGAGIFDAWLAHYDGTGNQTWIRQFGTTSSEWTTAAATDGAGGVYVSGGTVGSLGGPFAGGYDVWLAHYDGAGNQTWIRQFGVASYDRANAIAPDGSGGVYVSGYTAGSLGGPNAGGWDAWLAHYDGAGNQLWIQQLGTTSDEDLLAAAPDGAGGVYVSGRTVGSLGGPTAGGADIWVARYDHFVTTRYCTPAIPNSTGQAGVLTAIGSNVVAFNSLTVEASQLTLLSLGFFLTSQAQGFVTQPGGSHGILCLGGSIGRYVGPGQVMNSGLSGSFSLVLDLNAMPTPTGFIAAQPGDTWNFQAWHRDANAGPASNFTDAVSVTFL